MPTSNPNAIPKPWLLQFRDRFKDHWNTDSGWPYPRDSLISYIEEMTRTLQIKVAESRLFHQETGEIPLVVQNPACSNCSLWGCLNPYSKAAEEVLGCDPDQCQRRGLCNAVAPSYAPHSLISSESLTYTHQDFWCVLYTEEEPDDVDVQSNSGLRIDEDE